MRTDRIIQICMRYNDQRYVDDAKEACCDVSVVMYSAR